MRCLKKAGFIVAAMFLTLFIACGDDGKKEDGPQNPNETYTVSFDSNGGSPVSPVTGVRYGSTINAPTPQPTRAGYRFNGWGYSPAAGVVGNWAPIAFPYKVTGDVTLRAIWVSLHEENEVSGLSDLIFTVKNHPDLKYKLMYDIRLSGDWEPIGTWDVPFTGTFDGNGYIVSGMQIYNVKGEYAGFFGVVSGATIKNFTLEDVDIDVDAKYVGAIAGHIEDSTITDCYSSGNIYSYSVNESYAGGIAGIVFDSEITNCSNEGNIYSYSDYDYAYAGGIAGYAEGSVITNCYGWGEDYLASGYYAFAGGIAGIVADSEITNSYSMGDIIAGADDYASAGGIAGIVEEYSEITNSYSTGYIFAGADTFADAGGIAGIVLDSEITNCAAINEAIDSSHYAGRVVSDYDFSVISNNFALSTMTAPGAAKFNAADTLSHGISKTDDQLQMRSTYNNAVAGGGLGWSFGRNRANPWRMPVAGAGYLYPILYWE